MLDPLTILGVAGNVVQIADFGLKAVSKAREIHGAVDGATFENADLETVTNDLVVVNQKLRTSLSTAGTTEALAELSKNCTNTADDLLAALRKLKMEWQKTRWKSTRKALKGLWGAKWLEEMKRTIQGYRDELHVHVLADLKYVSRSWSKFCF